MIERFIFEFNDSLSEPLYVQLYNFVRGGIEEGKFKEGEKLPSLRKVAKENGISITTVDLAYGQLLVEGYIYSKPGSGYYVSKIEYGNKLIQDEDRKKEFVYEDKHKERITDKSCFDFGKWKKCISKVYNEYADKLMVESDPQGEYKLRYEIARYIGSSRGVLADPDQIVIGAGTQQITNHLSRILKYMGINFVSLEHPGYVPVKQIFTDYGFSLSYLDVEGDGIQVEKLPENISTAVYVNPSNQFPTGAVMSVGKKQKLLSWAKRNESIIIEDDYDSELRYFGKPVPSLKSFENKSEGENVVYLGSFSSTLYPAIKISYMLLPKNMADIFVSTKSQYTQTCSKAEQLSLAVFMEEGYYYTGIKKIRALYSQKLQAVMSSISRFGKGIVKAYSTQSGINVTLNVNEKYNVDKICKIGEDMGLSMVSLSKLVNDKSRNIIFYYNQIPVDDIDEILYTFFEKCR